jgi:altronate hydrolase
MNPEGSVLQIHPNDNVAVALRELAPGEQTTGVRVVERVAAGHKVSLSFVPRGGEVIKYGYSIGIAQRDIQRGEHVHSHNLEGALAGNLQPGTFTRRDNGGQQDPGIAKNSEPVTFEGFRRSNGAVGIRNEIWIINTVGCVNGAASQMADRATRELVREGNAVDGIYTFNHPFGCSQLGDDLRCTQLLLSGLAKHPNAAGVLVVGLGCENNRMSSFLKYLGSDVSERVRYFNAQEVTDEVATGLELIRELAEYAGQFRRERIPAGELILGMKCGGSDGLSGITANPLVGRIADRLAHCGGTSILTEVPEMFGAEKVLLERAADSLVHDQTIKMVNTFRSYFQRHNEPIDENPSPGNKEGGITTLAEKSLGCVQKSGTAVIKRVLDYGQQARAGLGGIELLNGPGNDGVSGSALAGAGAHMVLFTTGRGTPMGFPVPTMKISTNSSLAARKPAWIDFNAGLLAEDKATMDSLSEELFQLVLEIASGSRRTKNEINGYREIAIWKDGVTL